MPIIHFKSLKIIEEWADQSETSFISQAWAKQIILASYLQQNLETLFLVRKKVTFVLKGTVAPKWPNKKAAF